GRRMAQILAGKGKSLDLPIFSSPLPSHGILTPFRRIGQRIMYVVYHVQDEMF
ncbi:MAG: FAD-dependent oxidoreductase, partial [Stappiaceae bacterium]